MSLAFLPQLMPAFWHRFEIFLLIFWAAFGVFAIALSSSHLETYHVLLHTVWGDYVPFVALIFALFTISGGIHINLDSRGTPIKNVSLLMVASVMASFIGTTGASILFIRPILNLNKNRSYVVHTVVFFIFIVSNIAGCLTPLGDPPLFLGYLKGVPFSWPLLNLWQPFIFVLICLFGLYWCVDLYFFKKEKVKLLSPNLNISVEGKRNILLLLFVVFTVVGVPSIQNIQFLQVYDVSITSSDCLRLFVFIALGFLSFKITPRYIHDKQFFSFQPVSEIARVFLCIFITLAPVSQMLVAGKNGPFASLLALMNTKDPAQYYFWLTGFFSSFLDNAPTYIVFFELAGGNVLQLTTTHSLILSAISLGAVFMGALTYIGNAPNFMVRSIALQYDVKMPSFFGYMIWSVFILIPLFFIMSLLWL
ncbi:MAG: sodium:proton antiporter [Candidatus Paracaedibacteraceae bacterium]|nr:sodium:proton antiporter [Candidatus Paracaedibacteraceae bacterium]